MHQGCHALVYAQRTHHPTPKMLAMFIAALVTSVYAQKLENQTYKINQLKNS